MKVPDRSFVVRFVIADLGLIAGLIRVGLATARMVKAGGRTLGVVIITDLGRATPGLTAVRTEHPDPGLLGDIAGGGLSAARRGRGDQSNLAKREIPRPSAYSGCRPLRGRGARRERPQPLRPCDESPSE
jgi:hypothetical protein